MTSNFPLHTSNFSEDTLVQQTTADYLTQALGWCSVTAYNNEDTGAGQPPGTGCGFRSEDCPGRGCFFHQFTYSSSYI
jgi:hypothetical protein